MESIPLDFNETPPVENNKYGEKMQFEASGPYEKTRTKTDFCWLIGFILYLILWIVVIIYAFSAGNTGKGLKPKDSVGRICGYDSGVEDKAYLVHYNPESCEKPDCLVCHMDCPESDFDFEDYLKLNDRTIGYAKIDEMIKDVENKIETKMESINENVMEDKEKVGTKRPEEKPESENEKSDSTKSTTTNSTTSTTTSTTTTTTTSTMTSTTQSPINALIDKPSFDDVMKRIICQSDVNLDLIKKWDDVKYLVEHGKCSKTYKKTQKIYDNRCGFNFTSESSIQLVELSGIARDLYNTKWSIMGFIMFSGLIAIASIFAMRWYALVYVCISIFVICAVAFHYIYEKCVLNAESKTNGVLLALFLGVVALVLIVLIAIYFRKQLCLACQMIKESCKAITCVLSSLAVPFVFFLTYMLLFVLGVCVYYLLSTLEKPIYKVDFATDAENCECPMNLGYTQNLTCEPATFNAQCQQPTGAPCKFSGCYMLNKVRSNVGVLHLINYVGIIWSFWFVTGFNDIVLASVYSTWYWTFNKKILSYLTVIESFWRISTYHLGTVALGSLLILICMIITAILKSVKKSLTKISHIPIAAALLLSLQCVFEAVEKFIIFINRRAYVMCAMHGTDFFQSARTAYYLFMRNIGRVIAVVAVTNWLTFITSVLIACITTQISIGYYDSYRKDDLTYTSMPVLLIFLGSYAIVCLFMRAIEVAVDTVFICFLEDTERNDGTSDKPYFMSEQLTKFLYMK